MRISIVAFLALTALLAPSRSESQQPRVFTRADTIRGTNGPTRSWWDVTFYDLFVSVNPADSSISGRNAITYRTLGPGSEMQIDLQIPLEVDSVVQTGSGLPAPARLQTRRDGNAFFVSPGQSAPPQPAETRTLTVYYHGKPRVATNPPWEGGFIWQKDSVGNTWVATANQGLGASVWWPNKDWVGDEPDSQRVAIRVPDPMMDVSNGRLRRSTINGDGTTTYEWFVASPINNYNITVNAGRYAHWQETYEGESGPLTMDFWPLAVNEVAARRQWTQARPMMQCFEHWFGPFPWYQDGYKIVETPHLGMEHQSAIAYGNRYVNGYRGRDLSRTGRGLEWDFILVHESAHEWWGNNITVQDNAELWVHESFANYAENLYTECSTGSKEAGAEYVIGTRAQVVNDRPIVGVLGVNDEGSGDMYYKGGNMLHTIRQLVNDDDRWRGILRGLNRDFARTSVTGRMIQDYIARESGLKLDKVFEQYLHTTRIPVLEYTLEGRTLSYRWANVVPGFDMPVRVAVAPDSYSLVRPTEEWQTATTELDDVADFRVDENFYVTVREMRPPS
jgi:aminopeptidase N